MKVRELQKYLSTLDPELDVLCYCEDETLLVEGRFFVLFDILAVETTKAERCRLKDGTPYLKFGRGPASAAMAILEVTVNF